MKKLLAILLVAIMAVSLSACGEKQSDDNGGEANNVSQSEVSSDSVTSSGNEEWRQFINDYDAWVDNYIAIVKKYKANPTDTSILSDYTKLVSETADWAKRADNIRVELKDADEALEYSQELLKISNKLMEVAQ